jgi:FKBP-type peptidyl-prolyl cis-trans isomerase FkpA
MMSALPRLLLSFIFALTATAAAAQDRYVEYADTLPDRATARTIAVDRVVGSGAEATRGRFVVIQYEGWVYDLNAPERKGLKFDSTIDRGYALSVLIGVNRMIPGVDRAVLGMKVGGRRTLLVPPKLGYGSRLAYGMVPPDSTLLFEVELLDVVPEQNVN